MTKSYNKILNKILLYKWLIVDEIFENRNSYYGMIELKIVIIFLSTWIHLNHIHKRALNKVISVVPQTESLSYQHNCYCKNSVVELPQTVMNAKHSIKNKGKFICHHYPQSSNQVWPQRPFESLIWQPIWQPNLILTQYFHSYTITSHIHFHFIDVAETLDFKFSEEKIDSSYFHTVLIKYWNEIFISIWGLQVGYAGYGDHFI